MKILMFLVMFLMLGGFFIISNENLMLNQEEGVKTFLDSYGGWIDDLTSNGQGVIGHVVKMEWLPENGVEGEEE